VPRRSRRETLLDGFLVVDKEAGMTSHDVVGILRRGLGERRIGHAGTLDPDATGVLVVAVGRATRLMRFISGADKRYTGLVVFGATTTTLDAGGEVTRRFSMEVTLEAAREAARALTGRIEQIPPMVSAIKVDGKRLYELARQGEEIDRMPRLVEVTRFDVESTPDPSIFAIDVECSAGTYVRSLAADLGTALGGGAYLSGLRRTRVGRFGLDVAIDARRAAPADLRPSVELLVGLEMVSVEADVVDPILHGSVLGQSVVAERGAGPWALLDPAGELLAVYESFGDGRIKPIIVHAASPEAPKGASDDLSTGASKSSPSPELAGGD
jgi:tRNA pseudouridine55 synthase